VCVSVHQLDDCPRSGRPSKLNADMIEDIGAQARSHPFESSPKEIKHKLDLHVSTRTVRRRLDENGLHGRVAADEYDYSDTQLTQRQGFGEG
jgi:transposase